jgi:hypothetical protein
MMIMKLSNRALVSACLLLSCTALIRAQELAPNLRSSALRLIDGLDHDSTAFFYARKTLTQWFCENRKYDQALEQMANLPLSERIELITIIAKSAVDAREKAVAEKILSNAFSVLTNHGNDEAFFGDASYFAELALQNENLELAFRFVSMLDQGSAKKSRALLKLARARADLNDRKQVVTLVEEALAQASGFDEDEKVELIGLTVTGAHILASAGEVDRAKELAASANAALLSESEPSQYQAQVAYLFGAVGNLSQAIGMVESLDPDSRMFAFASLSLSCQDKQLARSLLDRSRELILAVKDDGYSKSIRLSELISVHLRADRADETFELLENIKDPYHLHKSAIAVANVLRKKGKIDEAEAALDIASKTAQRIVSEKSDDIPGYASSSAAQTKSHVLSALVENYVFLGSLQRAELAAKAIDHPQYRASALSRVALAYATKNECSKAQTLLNRALVISSDAKYYSHDQSKEDGLFNLVRAMSEAGFSRESTIATGRFLEEVRKNNSFDQYAGYLFILGDVAESKGTSLSKKSQTR